MTVARLQEKMKEKRLEKEKLEKQEQIERERLRRMKGKEMIAMKAQYVGDYVNPSIPTEPVPPVTSFS